MNVKLYNKERKVLVQADVTFGLDVLFVNKCNGTMNEDEFENWLINRTNIEFDYETDDIILKKLNLYHRKKDFGRMNEAKVLYAMLNNFKGNDDLLLYPEKTELISMVSYDWRYSNIYIWKSLECYENI